MPVDIETNVKMVMDMFLPRMTIQSGPLWLNSLWEMSTFYSVKYNSPKLIHNLYPPTRENDQSLVPAFLKQNQPRLNSNPSIAADYIYKSFTCQTSQHTQATRLMHSIRINQTYTLEIAPSAGLYKNRPHLCTGKSGGASC